MPDPLALIQLNHIARLTKNLETSRRFYIEVLGCREITRPAFSFAGAWLYVAGLQFHLIEEQGELAEPPSLTIRQNHIAFRVADLEETETKLRRHGVPYRRSLIGDRGIHQIFFHDPDGWAIEISANYSPIDR